MSEIKLLPCPFCGGALSLRGGVNGYGRCDTKDCWVHERATVVPIDDNTQVAAWNTRTALSSAAVAEREPVALQARVQPWMMACFGPEISADKLERADRFIEEALELVQSVGYDRQRVTALVDYVYGREPGEPFQEVGGVQITLAAFCLAHGLNMHDAGEAELARIWTKVEKIRAKQAAKPTGSALPIPVENPPTSELEAEIARLREQVVKATNPEYLAETIEQVGMVDIEWKRRAEAAEARLAEAKEAFEQISDETVTDDNGETCLSESAEIARHMLTALEATPPATHANSASVEATPPAPNVTELDWKNGEARSPSGDLYEVENLGGSVWVVRQNGTSLHGWHSSREDACARAQAISDRKTLTAAQEAGKP